MSAKESSAAGNGKISSLCPLAHRKRKENLDLKTLLKSIGVVIRQ